MRQTNETVESTTQLGRELLYRMKIAFGIHNRVDSAQIFKIKPLFHGMKDQIVRTVHQKEMLLLDAWYFKNELEFTGDTVSIQPGFRVNLFESLNHLPQC